MSVWRHAAFWRRSLWLGEQVGVGSPVSWIVCPTLGILFLRTTATFNLLLFSPSISFPLFWSLFGDPPPTCTPPGRKLLPVIAIAKCNPDGTYRTVYLIYFSVNWRQTANKGARFSLSETQSNFFARSYYSDPLQLSLLKLTSFNFQLEEIQNSLRNSSTNLNSSRSHSSFEIIEKIVNIRQNACYKSMFLIFVPSLER